MRKVARETAFKIVYMSHFLDGELEVDDLIEEEGLTEKEDIEYIKKLVDIYSQKKEEIDAKIEKKSNGFSLDRIYKIDLAILELAIAEMLYYKTPYKIVINEAVEISKKYSTEKSYSFVNGVLKSIAGEEDVI